MKYLNKGDKFKITEAHLKLVKKMYVGWQDCEFGAPEIDPKRPYGNSDVISDILKILGIPYDNNNPNKALEDFAIKIHKDIEIVLQIILVIGEFKEGVYELQESYNIRSWKEIK
jgi:hypothetical protein